MSSIQAAHFSKDASASEVMAHPESFTLRYFAVCGRGQTSRDILTFAGAKWEDTYSGEWSGEKASTPFGCLPLLFIRKGDKEALIKVFHSSSASQLSSFGALVNWNVPEARAKCYEIFKQSMLPNWIASHEKHLLSLADIMTSNLIQHFSYQPFGKEIIDIIRESPALWKLHETVISHPKLANSKSSEEFKKLEENTKMLYKDTMAAVST
ncbi:hypothetical protein BGW38_003657 [Lunasporangiospora selenospora]|uniref:Uncharacterized protein n=1 Tax=Lunasporangiospora selenospora TaxID=979761 RepID=A0A9P6FRJ4_9FUNG|nr:hypothetical protein BGW38_003657 [Lunasporangiospora selenospora]